MTGAVRQALDRAQQLGFLGDGPVEAQIAHALGYAAVHAQLTGTDTGPTCFLDLGSGGGLPGLVLAAHWTAARAVLLDSNLRRTEVLAEAVTSCGWESRVQIVRARAEAAGRDRSWRGTQELVVARSFGPPAVTAESAAALLCPGGHLIVSEPPEAGADRWPSDGLASLGLVPGLSVDRPFRYQVLRQVELCPERFPRREGVPAKRPLF